MLLNRPFNFVPLNEPEIRPCLVYVNDVKPVMFKAEGVGYLTTAVVEPPPGFVTFTCDFHPIMELRLTADKTLVGEGVLFAPTLHTGWRPLAASTVVGQGQGFDPLPHYGWHMVAGPTVIGESVLITPIPRINYQERVAAPLQGHGVLFNPTVRAGVHLAPSSTVVGQGQGFAPYSSVGTDFITFTGRGQISTVVGARFSVYYGGITLNPPPGVVQFRANTNWTLTTVKVSPKATIAFGTPETTKVVFSDARPKIASPHIVFKAAEPHVTVTQRPEPVVIDFLLRNRPPAIILKASEPVALQSTVRFNLGASIAFHAQHEMVWPTQVVTPNAPRVHFTSQSEIVLSTAAITPARAPAIQFIPAGQGKYSDMVPGIVNPQMGFQTTVGVVVGNLVVGATPAKVELLASANAFYTTASFDGFTFQIETQAAGSAQMGTLSVEFDSVPVQFSAPSASHIMLSTVTITPQPAQVQFIVPKPEVIQPPLVIHPVSQPITLGVTEPETLLGTLEVTPYVAGMKFVAEGAFKRGIVGTQYGGGPVVDTDDRHVLNVEPLNRPGQLRNINKQT